MWKDSRDNKLSKPSVDYQVMGDNSLLEIIAFSTESILDFQTYFSNTKEDERD